MKPCEREHRVPAMKGPYISRQFPKDQGHQSCGNTHGAGDLSAGVGSTVHKGHRSDKERARNEIGGSGDEENLLYEKWKDSQQASPLRLPVMYCQVFQPVVH